MLGSCVLPNSGDRVHFASVSTLAGENILFFPSLLGSFDLQHCTLWLVGHVQTKTLSWGRYFIPPRGLSVRRPSDCLRTVANRHGHTTVFPSPASERAAFPPPTDGLRRGKKTVGEREAVAAAGKGAASLDGRQRPGDYPMDSSLH